MNDDKFHEEELFVDSNENLEPEYLGSDDQDFQKKYEEVNEGLDSFSLGVLHPKLYSYAIDLFKRGHYGYAVFDAFKQVEIAVKAVGDFAGYGTQLMGKAFNAENGFLTDMRQPLSERKAMCSLFTGVIGLYKNPGSHGDIYFPVEEAYRLMSFASHLLFTVDSCNEMINDTTGQVYWDGFKRYVKEKQNQLQLFPKPDLTSIYGIRIDQKTLQSGDRHKGGAFWLIAYRSANKLQANLCVQSLKHYNVKCYRLFRPQFRKFKTSFFSQIREV